MKSSILIVDDEFTVRDVLKRKFEGGNYRVGLAGDAEEALGILEKEQFDLVLVDRRLPGMDGITLLGRIKEMYPSTEAVVLTAYGDVPSAVEAMKLGANDYITKPFELEEITRKVEGIFLSRAYISRDRVLKMEVTGGLEIPGYGMMVGISGEMKGIFRAVEALSGNMSSVLIQGESGTGKELVARAVHGRGFTRDKPFIAVTCSNVSPSLLISQLFGHVKGAFTGAVRHSKGHFRSAEGGSVFLDEIADTDMEFQMRLLRALQEREVVPLGSSEAIPVNVRVMAATNRDPEDALKNGQLREDLYYRLNTVTLRLPPLRGRREDIPGLTGYFLKRFAGDFRADIKSIHPETMEIFYRYPWPGNIRELEHMIERCYAIGAGKVIRPADLPPQIIERERIPPALLDSTAIIPPTPPLEKGGMGGFEDEIPSLEEVEREIIQRALKKAWGNKSLAAKMLGIERPRLYRKMKKYGIKAGEK